MDNTENEKSNEALDDEALDAVTGGGRTDSGGICPMCHNPRPVGMYHDPVDRTISLCICSTCAGEIGYVR